MKNKEIINLFNTIGITEIGFCKIEYFKELESILLSQESLHYKSSFQVGSIDEKTFKYNHEYKSAIVIAYPYKKVIISNDQLYLSSHAWENDYHLILKEKLNYICDYITKNGFKAFAFVDNNKLDERYLAYKSGVGFYGKNGLIINKKYGSFFFIGVILTEAIFDYSKTLTEKCISCNKCISNCPTKALNETHILDSNKCLSYLTQKKNVNDFEKKYFNNCVYGCDICINVCPYNKNVESVNILNKNRIELIDEKSFLNMSFEEYDENYKNNATFWRGKNTIDRNIKFYKENKLKNNK